MFNNSDKGRNNSNHQDKRKGSGISPVNHKFEQLYKLSKEKKEKLEKQRKEEELKAQNEFNFKPKLYKSKIKPPTREIV